MKLNLKAEVESRIRTHCSGCGIQYVIAFIGEPILYNDVDALAMYVRSSAEKLLQATSACKECKKKTEQISFYKEPFFP